MNVAGKRLLGTLALCLAAGVVLLAAIAMWRVWFWQARTGELERSRKEMTARLQTLDAEVVALSAQLDAASAHEPVEGAQSHPVEPSLAAADLARRIGELRTLLAARKSGLAELQFRGQQLEADVAHLGAETRKLAERQSELKGQVEAAGGVVQAMESELRGKEARLTPLELSVRSLRASRQAAQDAIRRQLSPARGIEELERRRETYLSGILTRYRQLAEQARLFTPRPDNPAANPGASLDLSRVQPVIGQAEETHRQIQALDAQASLLIDRMQKSR